MENRVKMLLLLFCGVFVTSVHSVKWTDVSVELGQDSILNCSLDKEVIWNMKLLGGDPVQILKTFSKKTNDATHCNDTFKARYSVEPGHRLVIHNVTVEDMTFYYCTDKLNNTTGEIIHLVSAGVQPDPTSSDLVLVGSDPTRTPESESDAPFWPNGHLTSVSLALNGILITALAAAGCCLAARRRNRPRLPAGDDLSPLTPDPPGNPAPALYEEIPIHNVQSPRSPGGGAVAVSVSPPAGPGLGSGSGSDECVYSKAQLPVRAPPPPPQ